MRKENLFRNKTTKGLVAALAVAMAASMVPASADAASKDLVIAKGDAAKLSVTGTKFKKGSYKVNNKNVSVNKKGEVTAKKTGSAKVTAVTKKGKKVTTKVKVVKAPTLSKKSVSVKKGNSKTISVSKNGAKYLKVTYKSNKTSVAKVNKNGKITGVKKGSAVVTATVKGYNKTWKLKCNVTVKKASTSNNDNDNNTPTNPDDNGNNTPVTPGDDNTPTNPDDDKTDEDDKKDDDKTDEDDKKDDDTQQPGGTVTPSTPTTTTYAEGSASKVIDARTKTFTVKLKNDFELTINRSDAIKAYEELKTVDTYNLPYSWKNAGAADTEASTLTASVSKTDKYNYSGTARVGSYIVDITVKLDDTELKAGQAKITVVAENTNENVSDSDITITSDPADNTLQTKEKILTGSNTEVTVTVNRGTLVVEKAAVKEYVDALLENEKDKSATLNVKVNGQDTPMQREEDVTNADILDGNKIVFVGHTTVNGAPVYLWVTGYKDNSDTADEVTIIVGSNEEPVITVS